MLKEKELCYRITGCVYEVYRHLGAGHKGEPIAEHRVDLLVENAVIIELKAQKQMPISAEPQLINYLKATGKELGLLVSFSFPKAVVKRVVL